MTEPAEKPTPAKPAAPRPGEPGEHPLSVLLFSWMRTPTIARVGLAALAAVCAALLALELVVERHPKTAIESVPGFHGLYGFIAFGLAVLSGWPLGRLLRRREDYYPYETEGGDDDD